MNYLVEFIEDSKNGIPKDEIQKKRASEVYDHYTQDLHGNSYIHDGWQKYVKSGIIKTLFAFKSILPLFASFL